MIHDLSDANSASSGFFWLQPDKSMSVSERHMLPSIQRLNDRYALFAYAIEGLDVLEKLRPGDTLVKAKVEEGAWRLLLPDESSEITVAN